MLFISDVQNRDINSAIEFSRKNEILSMSYNPKFLENGVSTSIFIGRKVVPYINVEALQKSHIELNNILLRVSKIYKKN
jgi:hypothetical protein